MEHQFKTNVVFYPKCLGDQEFRNCKTMKSKFCVNFLQNCCIISYENIKLCTFFARCLKSSVLPMCPFTPFLRQGSRILTTTLLISLTNLSLCFLSTSLLVSAAAWVVLGLTLVLLEDVTPCCGVWTEDEGVEDDKETLMLSGVELIEVSTASSAVKWRNSASRLALSAARFSSLLIFSIFALSSRRSFSSSSLS